MPSRLVRGSSALHHPLGLLAVTALHAGLAVAFRRWPMLATLHAAGTFLLGTVLLLGTSPHRVVYVVSYLIGAEVLWRMAGARVPWEFGKYAAIALLGGAIVRLGVRPRTAGPPVTYFLLLLPSVWLTLAQRDASAARGEVSFNLAGPFLLTVACTSSTGSPCRHSISGEPPWPCWRLRSALPCS